MVEFTWLPLKELSEQLYCSQRSIYKLKALGIFKPGTCFYRTGIGQKKGKCIYNLEKCREALLKHSEKGKKIKGAKYSKKMLNDLLSKEVK